MDKETEKEILSKCLYECVNNYLYDEIKKRLIVEEQTYSKQPLLLAHPSSVKAMKGGRMD